MYSTADEGKDEEQIKEGDIVIAPHYGRGKVQSIEEDKVAVFFPNVGIKRFKKGFIKREAVS